MNPCPLYTQTLRTPKAPVLISDRGAVSYSLLNRRVAHTTSWLLAQGLHAGDRLAVTLPLDEDGVILLFAALRAGLVVCPIDPKFPPDYAVRLTERLRCEATVGGGNAWHGCCRITLPDWRRIPAKAAITPEDIRRAGVIVWTSGSSAEPKAAYLRVDNLIASALTANRALGFGSYDRWLLSLSPHHVAGLGILFRCIAAGAAVVLPTPTTPPVEAIARHGVSHVSLVPAQLRRWMDSHPSVLGSLKCILLGGGPMPQPLIQSAREAGLPVVCSYGMTETCGLISTGKPLVPDSIAISDEGEILVRGAGVFAGYADAYGYVSARDTSGWFHTGDLGQFDPDGNLQVTGRMGTRFICGGENVHPEEVERYLRTLPGILDAVMVPVPDTEFGLVSAAFLDCGDGKMPDSEWIRHEMHKKLPNFKIPRYFLALPKGYSGALGKPKREELTNLATSICGTVEQQ